MAIRYVGGLAFGFAGRTTALSISLTSLSGGLASAPADGDLVIVFYGTGSTTDRVISVNSGYANLPLLSNDQGVYATNLATAYKFMGPTPDTSVEVSGTGVIEDAGFVEIVVLRGVDPTTPLDVTSTAAFGGNVTIDPPAITPVTPGAWVVVGGSCGNTRTGTVFYTSPDLSNFLSGAFNDTYDVTMGAGTYQWSSGAFNPGAWTFSSTGASNFAWAARTLALRPAPVAGRVKCWTGTDWALAYVWSGTDWVPAKVWDGTNWE